MRHLLKRANNTLGDLVLTVALIWATALVIVCGTALIIAIMYLCTELI